MTVLVTGAAGFIGYHVAEALLARGDQVIGVDNLNDAISIGSDPLPIPLDAGINHDTQKDEVEQYGE